MSKMRESKEEKFARVAYQYMDACYSFGLNLSKNHHDAEDLVQETYLKAYRSFDSFREGTNFRAWILRILRNNFITSYRKKARRPRRVDFEYVVNSHADTDEQDNGATASPFSRLQDRFDDEVYSAIRKIPDNYGLVVLLVDVYGMTYKEAAFILEWPIGTVMSRLSRARKKLRRSLSGYATQNGYV